MPGDPYLEKLLKRAAPKVARSTTTTASRDPRFGLPSDPESFQAFEKLVPLAHWGLGIHVLAVVLVVPAAVLDLRYAAIGLAAYVLAFIVHAVVNRARHRRFRGWPARLPFRLVGWDAVLSQKRVFADLCWTDLTVSVSCTAETRPYVEAALRLFAQRAEKAFYQVKIGQSDARQHWQAEGSAANGSANMEVMKHLRRLLCGDLSQIARRAGGVTEVALRARGDEYNVDIEITSSEGSA